jgi:hypothetical protein
VYPYEKSLDFLKKVFPSWFSSWFTRSLALFFCSFPFNVEIVPPTGQHPGLQGRISLPCHSDLSNNLSVVSL